MSDTVIVTYRFPKGVDAHKQAKIIAIGQTAGTWNANWENVREAFEKHMAHVREVRTLNDGSSEAVIEFPDIDFEGDIAGLLTIIFGKYSLAMPVKVVDIKIPDRIGTPYKFGLNGIRKLTGVYNRPFVMAIFKPALGLSPAQHAEILREVAFAGLDIIKDDEIMGDIPSAPVFRRLEECRKVMDELKRETGRNLLYAINLTGRVDVLLQRARDLVNAGANALMLNAFTYGFSVLEALAADSKVNVPIFVHPAFAGAMCISENSGLSYKVAFADILSRCGADAVLYPSRHGNLPFTAADESAVREKLIASGILPIPSAGIVESVLPEVLKEYGNDVALNAGTGIMDYNGGPAAGVKAFMRAL